MLERQYTEWEAIDGDLNVDTTGDDGIEEIAKLILKM